MLDEIMLYGKVFHSSVLSLKAIKVSEINNGKVDKSIQKDIKKSRFAVVASKKYFKTASLRNKVRRRAYAALTNIISIIDKGSNNFNCIIMLKPTVLELDQSGLKQSIHEIFVKSRIIT